MATPSSCSKEASGQLFAADFKMGGDIAKNARKGSDLDGIVIRNGDMVLAALGRDQPNVAASLAVRLVTNTPQCLYQFGPRQISWYLHVASEKQLQLA